MMYPMMYELHHILRIINCSQRRHIVTRGEEGEEGKERERERERVRYGYDEGFPVRGTASHWGTFIDFLEPLGIRTPEVEEINPN